MAKTKKEATEKKPVETKPEEKVVTKTESPKEEKSQEEQKPAKPVAETKTITHDAEEKIFTIPLRKAFRKSSKRRASYTTSLVKNFLKRHLKASDIKLGERLNRKIWEGGNNIPRKVRVKTFKDGETIKAELMGFEYKDFKALPKREKVGMKDRLMGRLGPKAMQKQKEEEMVKGEAKKPEKPQKIDKPVMEEK